jgi:hypothetical protein
LRPRRSLAAPRPTVGFSPFPCHSPRYPYDQNDGGPLGLMLQITQDDPPLPKEKDALRARGLTPSFEDFVRQARSIHWSPYDRVRVVNAVPEGLRPAHLAAQGPSLSIPAIDAFQLHLTPFNSTPTSPCMEWPSVHAKKSQGPAVRDAVTIAPVRDRRRRRRARRERESGRDARVAASTRGPDVLASRERREFPRTLSRARRPRRRRRRDAEARSDSHWSPYDPVGVVNFIP